MLKSGLDDPDYNLDRGQAAENTLRHVTVAHNICSRLWRWYGVCRLHFYDDYGETCCARMLCHPESIGSDGIS